MVRIVSLPFLKSHYRDVRVIDGVKARENFHDTLLLKEVNKFLERESYDVIGFKIPCYKEPVSKRETDVDIMGIDYRGNSIDWHEVKSALKGRLVKDALEQIHEGKRHLNLANKDNNHFPDIKNELSELENRKIDINYCLEFGNLDYQNPQNFDNEKAEVVVNARIEDDDFEKIYSEVRFLEDEEAIDYFTSRGFFNYSR